MHPLPRQAIRGPGGHGADTSPSWPWTDAVDSPARPCLASCWPCCSVVSGAACLSICPWVSVPTSPLCPQQQGPLVLMGGAVVAGMGRLASGGGA